MPVSSRRILASILFILVTTLSAFVIFAGSTQARSLAEMSSAHTFAPPVDPASMAASGPITDTHRPFDPRQSGRGQPWSGSGYPWQRTTRPAPLTALAARQGIDLEVTYINRAPMYKAYCVWYSRDIPRLCPGTENEKRWPEPGEVVTFTAHLMNKGATTSPAFTYHWLIDGAVVASGTHPALDPGVESTITYPWVWAHRLEGERLLDDHTVQVSLDPDNLISESYETNNQLTDHTNALSLQLAITPEMYQRYNSSWHPAGPFSTENWLQRQIAAMNQALANSIYPLTPYGTTERVRINEIKITDAKPINDGTNDGGWFITDDYRVTSGYYDEATDIDWGLIHELSHQIGLIDLYNLNISSNNVQVLNRLGGSPNMSFRWPRPGLMFGGDTAPYNDPHLYSSHSAVGLATHQGFRRGFYGEYQYDLPQQTYLRLLDSQGQPVSEAQVELYQRTGPWDWAWELVLDNTPEISGLTDSTGRLPLTNRSAQGGTTTATGHTLRDNPFGVVDVVGKQNRFLVKLSRDTHEEFVWLDITAFNLAYWQGHTISHTFTLATHFPPPAAPAGPESAVARIEGHRATMCWSASPSPDVAGYYLYRATPPTFDYKRVSDLVTELCYVENSGSGNRVYAVVAVDGQGRESGFSPPVWIPHLVNPAAVTITPAGSRIILDPQNGQALLRQRADGLFIQNIGSPHFHLENSQFLTIDPLERYVISHPGDSYSSRHSVRLAAADGTPLFEFGERGSGPGQFETPAGVAIWSQPCVATGCPFRIVVVDSGNHRLQAFDEWGNFVAAYGSFGSGPGQFNTPQGVTVDGAGRVVVADRDNNRLQLLNFDGTNFSFAHSLSADFAQPTGVASGGQFIVVADTGHHLIKVLNGQSQLRAAFDRPNDNQSGSFSRPRGVAVDPQGNIVVADTGNRRVVTIQGALAPKAAFNAGPVSGTAPLQVAFSDQSEGNPTTWAWDFGDGMTDTRQQPTHTYTTPGTYPVTLTVGSPTGQATISQPDYITVYGPVEASFTTSPPTGPAPLAVTFTNTSYGTYTTTAWDFGDGTTSPEANPQHTYTNPGSYLVTLTVTGPGGSATQTTTITVTKVEHRVYLPLVVR